MPGTRRVAGRSRHGASGERQHGAQVGGEVSARRVRGSGRVCRGAAAGCRAESIRRESPGELLLYPFRFVDPVTGRWVRARYKAERHELVQRYAQWEITGAPEIRRVGSATSDTF